MANTTAKQRELARLYESRGEHGRAAQCWEEAVRLCLHVPGQLAERDRMLMTQRAKECRWAAAQS